MLKHKKIKATMLNMLKTLMDNSLICNAIIGMEMLVKNQKKKIKNIVNEINNAFDPFINRFSTDEEIISEFGSRLVKTLQTEIERRK